jgi:hypothetical protein
MNKRLNDAVALISELADEKQEAAAALLLDFLSADGEAIELTPEQVAEIERRLDADDIASDEEVKAFFERMKK